MYYRNIIDFKYSQVALQYEWLTFWFTVPVIMYSNLPHISDKYRLKFKGVCYFMAH